MGAEKPVSFATNEVPLNTRNYSMPRIRIFHCHWSARTNDWVVANCSVLDFC